MFKNKSKIITFLLILVLFISSTSFVFADDNDIALISADNVKQAVENEVTDQQNQEENYKKSDVYLVGDDITIDYIVDGNLFVMANKVTINSQIGGDAFILAKEVVVDSEGYIFNNLFACAQSIDIKGVVYDAYTCAENLSISGGYVYRDLKSVSKNININGVVGRNAFVSCENIVFNSDENSNKKGMIYGNLEYSSKSESTIPEGCVSGDVKFTQIKINSNELSTSKIIANYLFDLGAFLSFVLIIWLLCLWITPKFLDSTNTYVGKNTLKAVGYGLLTLIAIPVISLILILLNLTSGIALLLIALYILALVISKSLFTITANKYICSKLKIDKNTGIFGMLIVSGIIVWVLTQLPYVGGVISFITVLLGLGILVLSILPKKDGKNSNKETVKESK